MIRVTVGGKRCNVVSSTLTSVNCTPPQLPAGVWAVKVFVIGKGQASTDSVPVTVSYGLEVNSIYPSEGSLAGRTVVTMTGQGFSPIPHHVDVMIGNIKAKVISSNFTEVLFATPRHNATEALPVTMTVNNVTATAPQQFAYNKSLTNTITAISPSRAGAGGGSEIVISMENMFITNESEPVVYIGKRRCNVTEVNDTTITCLTSPHKPGNVEVDVFFPGIGGSLCAESKINNMNSSLNSNQSNYSSGSGKSNKMGGCRFNYVLYITSVTPPHGSIVGHTSLMIHGGGFGSKPGDVKVTLGKDRQCRVTSVKKDRIVCTSTPIQKVHIITNGGSDASKPLLKCNIFVTFDQIKLSQLQNEELISKV